jgi:hypothetical protein
MAVQFGDSPIFQRLISLPSSGSLLPAYAGFEFGLKMEMILQDDT